MADTNKCEKSTEVVCENIKESNRQFILYQEQPVKFYMSIGTLEEKGLHWVMEQVCEDIRQVTGVMPELNQIAQEESASVLDTQNTSVVVAGSFDDSPLIQDIICTYQLPVKELQGKRECYRYFVVEPENKTHPILCIIGSDRLGTFYGLYHLSKLCGISAWGYWADAVAAKKDEIIFSYDELNIVSKEPSVRLRGFFINDEWPSLGSFVMNQFGGFNEEFYARVFELLLRLNGNFLWPAMWSASFPCDGKRNPSANAQLADELGITMGTSHHEPMMRASEEWDKVKSFTNHEGYGRDWSYLSNERGLNKYWADAVLRSGNYKNLITLGMRGERDSKLLKEQASLQQNVELLQTIIQNQKNILKRYKHENDPKVLALYKEVEDYYYGNAQVQGLKGADFLNDVLLLLSDDNYGNTRMLPQEDDRDRTAGWGIYYHLDYHGAPVSYEWINSTPLTKIWEQMTMAYEFGIRDLWIVNVGDIRPQELPLSYFMDMAYDYETWGASAVNQTTAYTMLWAEQIFGGQISGQEIENIVWILKEYSSMNGQARPETVSPSTFHSYHEREAQRALMRALTLEQKARELNQRIPKQCRNACFSLVVFPALATANLWKMQIYAGFYKYFAADGCLLCNEFAARTQECIMTDQRLQDKYNTELAGGKWKGMMSSAHVGFTHWNDEGWSYPQTPKMSTEADERFFVYVENVREPLSAGKVSLSFSNLVEEQYQILVTDNSENELAYRIDSLPAWIQITSTRCLPHMELLTVSVDFTKLTESKSEHFYLKQKSEVVEIECCVDYYNKNRLPGNTYIETQEVVSIEAIEFYSNTPAVSQNKNAAQWVSLTEYGKSRGAIKVIPPEYKALKAEDAPSVSYHFWIHHEGTYTFRFRLLPSNPVDKKNQIRFAASLDELPVQVFSTVDDTYAAGDYNDVNWCKAVLHNERIFDKECFLTKGLHVLCIYGIDPALGIEKIEIAKRPSDTYYGYQKTYQLILPRG